MATARKYSDATWWAQSLDKWTLDPENNLFYFPAQQIVDNLIVQWL